MWSIKLYYKNCRFAQLIPNTFLENQRRDVKRQP